MPTQDTPLLTLVCGPNGAGKSTYTALAGVSLEYPVVDADRIAAETGLGPVAAGREAYRRIQGLLANQRSFARESTLTAKFDFELMQEAKRQGYHVRFVYIGLDSPTKSMERVGSRFAFGGHDVPEADLLRRYGRSLENLPQAVSLADTVIILNNNDKDYKPVAVFEKGALIKEYATPAWFKQIRTRYIPAVPERTVETEYAAEWLETNWKHETARARALQFAEDLNKPDSPLFNAQNQLPSYNPLTKTVYSGINRVILGMRGYDDPRWVTFEQANRNNWFVKPNEQGTPIEVWSFKRQVPEQNPATGQPVLDASGKQVFKEIAASQAQRKINYVFHVSQLETASGHEIEPFQRPENSFSDGDIRARLDLIIKNSGVTVVEPDSENRANLYDEQTNTITMASRDLFNSDAEYNSNLLYMLSKAAVYQRGMDADLAAAGVEAGNPELENELRARLAAWMAGQDLGMDYTADRVGNSTSDTLTGAWNRHLPKGWTEMLEQSPALLTRAARDAEKIRQSMLDMGLNTESSLETGESAFPNAGRLELWRAANPDMGIVSAPDSKLVCNEAIYFNAPFAYRHEVRALGAQLVRNKKVYRIPASVDILPLSEFLPMAKLDLSVKTLSPEQTLAKTLTQKGGFVFADGELPVLDGKIHRVAVRDGSAGIQDGVYQATVLNENGQFGPNGWYINHKTEQSGKWQYSMQALNEEAIRKMEQEQPLNPAEIANVAGNLASIKWENAKLADNGHEYLQEHVFANNPDLFGTAFKVDEKDNLMQAGYKLKSDGKSVTPQLTTVHYITPDGEVFFEPGCDNKGAMAILGDLNKLGNKPVYIADTVLNAASLHAMQHKDSVVVACFTRENLHGVIEEVRNAYPDNKLIIAANTPGEIPKPLMPEQFTPDDIREVNASFDIAAIATSYTARERYTLTANSFNDLREAAAKTFSIRLGETDIEKLNERAADALRYSGINDKYMGTQSQRYMDGLQSMREKEEYFQFTDWFQPTHDCYEWAEQNKLEALGIKIENEFMDDGHLAFPCRMFYRYADGNAKIGKSTYGIIDPDGRQGFAEQCRPCDGYKIIDPCNRLRSNTAVERILITDSIADAYSVAYASFCGLDDSVQPTLCCVTVDNAAFTVGNIREFFPDSEIVLCASLSKDPDVLNIDNACELAEKFNCKIAYPALTEQEQASGLKTFNDMRLARGNANALEASLKKAATPANIKKQIQQKTQDMGMER